MNLPFQKTIEPLTAWFARVQRRFSPGLKLRRLDGVAQVRAGTGAGDWIVARGLSAYTVLDGAGVPSGRRKAFALGQARRWAPFPDPSFHTEWIGDRVMVWAWSAGAVLEPARMSGERLPRRLLPESLFR